MTRQKSHTYVAHIFRKRAADHYPDHKGLRRGVTPAKACGAGEQTGGTVLDEAVPGGMLTGGGSVHLTGHLCSCIPAFQVPIISMGPPVPRSDLELCPPGTGETLKVRCCRGW